MTSFFWDGIARRSNENESKSMSLMLATANSTVRTLALVLSNCRIQGHLRHCLSFRLKPNTVGLHTSKS